MNAKSTPVLAMDIDCIIPAAGLSSRMGDWKLMLPYDDCTLLETSVKNALAFCSRVILVVGYRADEVIQKMKPYTDVEIVYNEHYQQGMLSSILTGIEQVKSDYFFITHADMPCIEASVYAQLWSAKSERIIFPGHQARSGHPVLIPAAFNQAILNAPESRTMKAILKHFPTTYLSIENNNIYFDVDTPDTYQQLCLYQINR